MPSLSAGQTLKTLRETNADMRFWLEHLALDPAPAPTPQLISGLLSALLRAGELLRAGLPGEPDLQLQAEVGEYRRNLERLRDRMPGIHRHLLAERARLESERARIESAGEWAQASQQTL